MVTLQSNFSTKQWRHYGRKENSKHSKTSKNIAPQPCNGHFARSLLRSLYSNGTEYLSRIVALFRLCRASIKLTLKINTQIVDYELCAVLSKITELIHYGRLRQSFFLFFHCARRLFLPAAQSRQLKINKTKRKV